MNHIHRIDLAYNHRGRSISKVMLFEEERLMLWTLEEIKRRPELIVMHAGPVFLEQSREKVLETLNRYVDHSDDRRS